MTPVRLRRVSLPFVVLMTAMVAGTALAGLLFSQLAGMQRDEHTMPIEDGAWVLYQVQAEFLRTRLLLSEARRTPTTANEEAALLRYEIFQSRLHRITQGRLHADLGRHRDLAAQIARVVQTSADIDRELGEMLTPDARLAVIETRFAAADRLVQELTVAVNHATSVDSEMRETALEKAHAYLQALFATLVVIALLSGAVAWMQARRSARESAKLMELSAHLRDERNRAETASRAKSVFLANMSHELRTPLNAIIGFAEVIAGQFFGPVTPKRYAEYGADIHQSGRYLLSLVNDLLDLAKIEAGRMDMAPDWLDPQAAAADTLKTCEAEAARGQLSLVLADFPARVQLRADQRALRQMLLNLVSNAMKFTCPGGRIVLRAEATAEGLALSVIDNGRGIAPDLLKRLMEPFVQGAAEAVQGQQGTGLGLSITRRLMEMHGGTLTIDSAPDQGTTARLVFPPGAVRRDEAPVRRAA
ncbi:MAG: HAMP domain-containing histidine kinase [Rhodospirillales bacterium]|nr:HAMP domain-containing histidine kinase [Rhodospirillales bacterium]